MTRKLGAALVLALALTGAVAFGSSTPEAAAQSGGGGITVPVTCTTASGEAQCTLTLIGFRAVGNTLQAVFRFVNTTTGQATTILVPVGNISGSCQILDLTIGPINLELLGLRVQTNTIHLQVTAQAGPGNLLGNLLCAIAGLLDRGGPLSQLATLLNRLLSLGAFTLVP